MPNVNGPRIAGVSFKRFAPGEGARLGEYDPGDFILTHGSAFFSKLIRFGRRLRFRGKNRKYAWWNHAAMIVSSTGDLNEALGPGLGIPYLLLELFGSTDDERAHVYLSDGGHFENLGIYEFVRRRSKLILACDASEDREYKFEGLGNAIRKCRDDFGVDITINVDNLRAVGKSGQSGDDDIRKSKQHCAVGVISYDKVWPDAKPGILVYVKASLTGDEPADVLEYKNSHPDFPHDSTADQWFSESQFESYRKLGQHIIEQCKSVENNWRQRTPVLHSLEKRDEWWTKETTDKLEGHLAKEPGGVHQP